MTAITAPAPFDPAPVRSEPLTLARVRAAASALGPSEGRVADVILTRGSLIIDWSTADLAAASGTSPATVIRACQSLGFRGFQHLRLEAARWSSPATGSGDGGLGTAIPGTAFPGTEIFDEAIDALRTVAARVDPAAISAAAARIAAAGRVVLVGSGFSAPPLQDAALRFATIGRPTEFPGDVLGQQFAAHSLGPGDVCLALSYSGANSHTLAACRAAHDRGGNVIVLTSFARSPLTRLADLTLLSAPVGGGHDVDPFLSRLGQFVLLHALHREVAAIIGSPDTAEMRGVVADALAEQD